MSPPQGDKQFVLIKNRNKTRCMRPQRRQNNPQQIGPGCIQRTKRESQDQGSKTDKPNPITRQMSTTRGCAEASWYVTRPTIHEDRFQRELNDLLEEADRIGTKAVVMERQSQSPEDQESPKGWKKNSHPDQLELGSSSSGTQGKGRGICSTEVCG